MAEKIEPIIVAELERMTTSSRIIRCFEEWNELSLQRQWELYKELRDYVAGLAARKELWLSVAVEVRLKVPTEPVTRTCD